MILRDPTTGCFVPRPKRAAEDRFFEKVSPEPNTGCHLWAGAVHKETGYGVFAPDGVNTEQAHRFAFFLKHGRYPRPGYEACHTCDVRSCVNDAHLFEGTRKDNMQDASRKGRTTKGERSAMAKLSLTKATEIRAKYAAGVEGQALAKEYGVSKATISGVVNKRRWSEV